MANGVRLPPSTSILKAIRAEKHPFYSFAGEVIDNAFDWQATQVDLIMNDRVLSVSDNGIGVERGKEDALVRLGAHEDNPGTKLGRYGVGLKYKAVSHGNMMKIRSVSKFGLMRRWVDWDLVEQTDWTYQQPDYDETITGPTGTTITISELTRTPKLADIVRTEKEIQRRYYPALEKGSIITLNGNKVEPIKQPELLHSVTVTAEFPGGREALVHGGVLANPKESKLHQVDLVVDFRVIKTDSLFGCNGFGGTRSMFARVELMGPWKLSKFKDDLADDPHEEDLEKWVHNALLPILERCQSEAMYLHNKKLERMMNDMLPADRMVRPEQEQSLGRIGKKLGRIGTVDSRDAGPGPAKSRKTPRGIKIRFEDCLHEEYGPGRVVASKSVNVIELATDNPIIRTLQVIRDEKQAASSLFMIAALIYEGESRSTEARLFHDEKFGRAAWNLAGPSIVDDTKEAA